MWPLLAGSEHLEVAELAGRPASVTSWDTEPVLAVRYARCDVSEPDVNPRLDIELKQLAPSRCRATWSRFLRARSIDTAPRAATTCSLMPAVATWRLNRRLQRINGPGLVPP